MCLVGHLNVPGAGVGLRVDGDGGHTEALGGAHDPAGDLAAVGDQQLSKYMNNYMFDREQGTRETILHMI